MTRCPENCATAGAPSDLESQLDKGSQAEAASASREASDRVVADLFSAADRNDARAANLANDAATTRAWADELDARAQMCRSYADELRRRAGEIS